MQSIPKFSMFTLIYVMSISVGQWFCDSIDHKWVENDHMGQVSELISMFGESQAKKILLIFLPIWNIYWFHSAIVAYNLIKKPRRWYEINKNDTSYLSSNLEYLLVTLRHCGLELS